MCLFASGDTVSIVPIFRQFRACFSDGNGASFRMMARYAVSFRCRYKSYTCAAWHTVRCFPASLVRTTPGVHPAGRGTSLSPENRVADLSPAVILSTRNSFVPLDTTVKECPQLWSDQMKKVGLADWRTSNGLPSASDPETEADRTPRESLLACMTANR